MYVLGSDSNLLKSLQIEGARVATGALKWTNRVSLLNELCWVDLSVRGKFHKLRLICAIYVRISFLTDTVVVCVLLTVSVYPTFVLIGIKHRFFFHQLNDGTVYPLEIRTSFPLDIFKHSLLKYLQFPSRYYLFHIGDQPASISHTRLRFYFLCFKMPSFLKELLSIINLASLRRPC